MRHLEPVCVPGGLCGTNGQSGGVCRPFAHRHLKGRQIIVRHDASCDSVRDDVVQGAERVHCDDRHAHLHCLCEHHPPPLGRAGHEEEGGAAVVLQRVLPAGKLHALQVPPSDEVAIEGHVSSFSDELQLPLRKQGVLLQVSPRPQDQRYTFGILIKACDDEECLFLGCDVVRSGERGEA